MVVMLHFGTSWHILPCDIYRYNDVAVLENMHVSEAFRLLNKRNCDFLNCFSHLDFRTLRKLVISMVLHTDMERHKGDLMTLTRMVKFKKTTKAEWLDRKDPDVTNCPGIVIISQLA